ncbi:2-isopropylmalate synthase, partial [Candidatus Woesearchaeota archaeon CG10_big_fil_rev_8_21_14_0_10_30_7]
MVQILDTTLREGEQTPGVYFPIEAKIAIAKQLDKVGVNIIEAGHPLVSSSIHEAVSKVAKLDINAIVGAHSRSLKKDVDLALECGVSFLGIFYCVSDERLNEVFKKDLTNAISQITEVICYAKQQNPDLIIRYTPEDTVRSKFENVVTASVEAVKAGADIISVADTTGYMIPRMKGRSMYDFVSKLKSELNTKNVHPKIAVHCHNDLGFAISNAIEGFEAGAE